MSKFRNGNYEEALQELPKKETGGFITTLEKNWIGFWDGRSNPEALKKLSHSFDQRKYISVSREASYFFFQESEEGYIPAEHEMVVLHLVTAMSFYKVTKSTRLKSKLAGPVTFFRGSFARIKSISMIQVCACGWRHFGQLWANGTRPEWT